jgi:lipoprotein-anchoring transpeptidase ErfK/SrfK
MLLVKISVIHQTLDVCEGENVFATYPISTSRYGVGEEEGSFKTPRGLHQVAQKIGENAPLYTRFVGRVPTGEMMQKKENTDLILTRILRLRGLDDGLNVGAGHDSFDRYIYIHGAATDAPMSAPGSIGCIRMINEDIIKLYAQVVIGTEVYINA